MSMHWRSDVAGVAALSKEGRSDPQRRLNCWVVPAVVPKGAGQGERLLEVWRFSGPRSDVNWGSVRRSSARDFWRLKFEGILSSKFP